MGSCASLNREPKSTMGMRFSVKPEKGRLLKASSVKKNSDTAGTLINGAAISQFGSKDEAFFDSQAWLDSDCEDDYLSVNDDFTSSQGSTPLHPSLFPGNSPKNDILVKGSRNSSSRRSSFSSDKKRRLSELFQESRHSDRHNPLVDGKVFPAEMEAEAATGLSQQSKSANGTPHFSEANSVCSNERTPNRLLKEDNKSTKASQCCLPRLL